jgi:hypothetical protein
MIQVSLPDQMVEQLQAVADREGSALADVLAEAVEQYIALSSPVTLQNNDEIPPWKVKREEQERQIDEEQKRYEARHSELFKQYAGQYIAMYKGEVVDKDSDDTELSKRIRARFVNTAVLITPVLKEPIQTFYWGRIRREINRKISSVV